MGELSGQSGMYALEGRLQPHRDRYAVPLKLDGYLIILGNTKKKLALGELKYNERVSECAEGLRILSKYMPDKNNLCDITIDEFEQYKSEIKNEITA